MARMYYVALALALALAVPLFGGDNTPEADARAKVVAPFLDDQTVAVAHVDVSKVDAAATVQKLKELVKLENEGDGATRGPKEWLDAFTKAGGKDLYFVFSMADFPRHATFALVPLAEGAEPGNLAKLLSDPGDENHAPARVEVVEKLDKVLFAGSKTAAERVKSLKATPRPELAKAFAAAGDTAVQVLLLPTADARRVLEETMPELPKVIGGGASTVLTRGVRWAALGLDLPPKMSAHLTVQSDNAEAAKGLQVWTKNLLKALSGAEFFGKVLAHPERLAELNADVKDDQVVMSLDQEAVTSILQPSLVGLRQASDSARSSNNLKQIGLAMWNYYDVHKGFPSYAKDKDGKSLLSWRVHILPFVEQEKLYKEFHLDEPWDSEHNKKLIDKMPAVFRAPGRSSKTKTTYLGVAGKSAMFPADKTLVLKDVSDGTSNTIWVVEVAEDRAVTWTQPGDFEYNPQGPSKGLAMRYGDKFIALFVDGSVRLIKKDVDDKTLNALFTRDGGETIPADF